MNKTNVISVGLDDLHWSFERGEPQFYRGVISALLDPCPAYGHDPKIVRKTLREVVALWPNSTPITYWLLPLEEKARTNAFATSEDHYRSDKPPMIKVAHVVVCAKRIPPHPAMTRYLVAHEYGHHVQRWMAKKLDMDREDILTEYSKLRGLESSQRYGAGTWHKAAGEIFACDFRVIVTGIETEYWPHPGIPRPDRKIIRWWNETQ